MLGFGRYEKLLHFFLKAIKNAGSTQKQGRSGYRKQVFLGLIGHTENQLSASLSVDFLRVVQL